jgi:hypothetical protein
MGNTYVLAMYDVRGKQEYIFRKNQIKEIVGGSCIIRDCFKDYLYPAAKKYRNDCMGKEDSADAIYQYQEEGTQGSEAFDTQAFRKRMEGNIYLGEVVYEGGGNFIVLYRDKTCCVEINKIFTKNVMMATETLKVLCTYIEVGGELSDYVADRNRLYEKHRINEAQESVIRPVNAMPFVQVDPVTSLPLSECITAAGNEKKKVSRESYAKYQKYYEVSKENKEEYGEKVLDHLVKKKGEDSLLAVIFIDGNNMGAKVQGCLKNVDKSYQASVTALRKFSAGIQKNYVDDRMAAIDEVLGKKYGEVSEEEAKNKRRFVVYAGDEMSFICRAEDALDIVKAYFADMPKDCSSCAGIAIFHSHAPYAEAYRIAEECCESGKKKMKEAQPPETTTCYVDYHYCQGGLGMELEDIREREIGDIISKPWLIKDNAKRPKRMEKECVTLEEVERVVKELNLLESRTNIKGLAERAMSSQADFDMEMSRIYAHQSKEIQNKIAYTFRELEGEKRKCLIYDIIIAYDLWFRPMHQEKEGENK